MGCAPAFLALNELASLSYKCHGANRPETRSHFTSLISLMYLWKRPKNVVLTSESAPSLFVTLHKDASLSVGSLPGFRMCTLTQQVQWFYPLQSNKNWGEHNSNGRIRAAPSPQDICCVLLTCWKLQWVSSMGLLKVKCEVIDLVYWNNLNI